MTDTLNTRLFVFVLSFLPLIGTVRADSAYPVLSYKCLRDEDKIRFDYKVLYNEAGRDFHYSESDGTYDPWKLVTTKEQNGFSAIVDIKKVEHFCSLSSGNYKVVIEPSPGNHNLGGRCGAQMSAAVAVYRGEVEVLKKVSFEGDCHYSDDAITSITVLGSTGAVDIRYLSDPFALHKAIKKSDIQAIKVHLKKGANPNERDHNGETPILLAVKSRNLPICELLIQGGAETQEALSIASSEGASEIVKVLLKSGVDVNGSNNPSHRGSALMLAAYGGHSEVVKLLINGGADVNAKGTHWTSVPSLLAAAKNGHYGVVEFLVNAGADVNVVDNNQTTALMTATKWARSESHVKIVKFLINHGASVTARDKTGRIALDYATQHSDPSMRASIASALKGSK